MTALALFYLLVAAAGSGGLGGALIVLAMRADVRRQVAAYEEQQQALLTGRAGELYRDPGGGIDVHHGASRRHSWPYVDLSGAYLTGANLKGANLSGADLSMGCGYCGRRVHELRSPGATSTPSGGRKTKY